MAGHLGVWVYNPWNCFSFSAVTDTRRPWAALVLTEQVVGAEVARFLLLLSIMGLQGQLAPRRPDDPHAVFALKDRNEFMRLLRLIRGHLAKQLSKREL